MKRTSLPPRGLSDRQISNHDAPSLRLYQVWKGNNIFALRGRLIFGPDARSLYLTICLIVVPVILFCSLVSQSLVKLFPNNIGLILVAIPAVFTVYVIKWCLVMLQHGPADGLPMSILPPKHVSSSYALLFSILPLGTSNSEVAKMGRK